MRWFARELVLVLARVGPQGPRTIHWFYRVRNLEYFRGVVAAGGIPAARTVRVLCYHSIADLEGAPVLEPYGIPPSRFRRQLRLLDRHFRILDAAEFGRFLQGAGVPSRSVLLTFNNCSKTSATASCHCCASAGLPALAFAVTGRVGKTNNWDAPLGAIQLPLLDAAGLRALVQAEVAVGSHSRTHRMLNRVPADELPDETDGSAADLEALGLERPWFFAYPHGEHDAAARRAVAAAGFQAAFTVSPDWHGSIRTATRFRASRSCERTLVGGSSSRSSAPGAGARRRSVGQT